MNFFKNYSIVITTFFALLLVGAMVFVGNRTKPVNNGSFNLTAPVVESQKQSSTQKSNSESPPSTSSDSIPVRTLANVRKDCAVQIEGSEVVNLISVEHPFMKVVTGNGEQLLVVYVTLKNTGNDSGDMLWAQFQLVDDQARKYNEIEDAGEKLTVWTWLDSKGLSQADDQLSPGSTAKTAKVFRVASDAVGLKVIVSDTTFSLK